MNTYLAIALGLMIADRVATATPKDWKPLGIPVGKYDDGIVKFLKGAFNLFGNRSSS